ncbi:EamA family transporter [Gemmatimonadota bacterium]
MQSRTAYVTFTTAPLSLNVRNVVSSPRRSLNTKNRALPGALAAYVWFGSESFVVPDAQTWVVLFAYAIVCHVIGWVLISSGLPGMQTSRAGLLLLLQPALAFVWDVVLFGRPTAAIEITGAALALTAIYLGTVGGKREDSA